MPIIKEKPYINCKKILRASKLINVGFCNICIEAGKDKMITAVSGLSFKRITPHNNLNNNQNSNTFRDEKDSFVSKDKCITQFMLSFGHKSLIPRSEVFACCDEFFEFINGIEKIDDKQSLGKSIQEFLDKLGKILYQTLDSSNEIPVKYKKVRHTLVHEMTQLYIDLDPNSKYKEFQINHDKIEKMSNSEFLNYCKTEIKILINDSKDLVNDAFLEDSK